MVVLGSQRLQCPHCGRVQFQPIARRYVCRGCRRGFTAEAARAGGRGGEGKRTPASATKPGSSRRP